MLLEGKPRLLDLFCGAGGAARGYADAGFEVVGVDIKPQPNYPFEFVQADALEYAKGWAGYYTAIHASPPCQAFSKAHRINKYEHPDLLTPLRPLLEATRLPWVIENVPGAPMHDVVELCGAMFPDLRVYRHRWFESNISLIGVYHPESLHKIPQAKMGRPPKQGEFIQVVGNFSDVAYARRAMGIPWMTRDELSEAIPPAYTRFIGMQLMDHIEKRWDLAA